MSPTRPPRDREAAPGTTPGAESFAGAGEREAPQGIVRLSDLFAPADFAADGATDGPPAATAGRRARATGRPSAQRAAERQPPAQRSEDVGRDPAPQSIAADAAPVAGSDALSDAGPAYESLFGSGDDTRRRQKRERKPATALQRALGLLTRREHSRKELTRKLVSRGVDAAEVEAAVDRLTGAGWQDDARFAESLVRSRAANGYGPLHIRAELGTHDLPAELRQAALDDFDGDWVEIARDLVARRFGRIEDARLRQRKASDYLIRRGFPGDVVRAAVRLQGND